MSKQNDDFYYNKFIESASVACEAAQLLKNIMENYEPDKLSERKDELHEIEHKGDQIKHDITYQLARAFITPIERDDIMELSQNLDDVIDSIDDVVINMYITNITEIRKGSIEFADIIIKCCNALKNMLVEFHNFRKSKTLNQLIIDINCLEEEGDRLYIENMKKLHTNSLDTLTILAWRDIYGYLEKCCDACEHVADVVESIVIGNT